MLQLILMLQAIKRFYQTYSHRKIFILASFVLFWPLAVYLLWRHRKWSIGARSTITTILVGFTLLIGLGAYNAPPSISLSNNAIANGYKTDDNSVVIAGKISTLHSSELLINGKSMSTDASGKFSYRLPLNEGDTEITIVARSDKGDDNQSFKVHRTTASEFAERKKLAEERKKSAELKVAKAEAAAKDKALKAKVAALEKAEKARVVAKDKAAKAKAAAIAAMPICNGTSIKAKCKADGAVYEAYVYHAAVIAKTHQQTETTYKEEITGYCTLCTDGTYSPTCATGRGACSWHGGVAQWSAPIKSRVPVYSTKLVVDVPAKEAYYDKVLDGQYE